MMPRIRGPIDGVDDGFTFVELLVVIVIIGILSAVAIPLFVNQVEKAEDAAAKEDVSTLGAEIATHYLDAPSSPVTVAQVGGVYLIAGVSIGNSSTNVELTAPDTNGWTKSNWCVHVTNESGVESTAANGGFSYSAANGLRNATCP